MHHAFTHRSLLAQARQAGIPNATVRGLFVRSEQVPNPDSRILLSSRRNRLGQPLAQLDWRLSGQDIDSVDAWLSRLESAVGKIPGSHVMVREDWQRHILGGPHHSGTTRMSTSPHDGVVDKDLKVHSVENLYVAGSSVFATGGFANPTFPLVALALRLADHLRLQDGREALHDSAEAELP
jgi:choline dehydrogenase-like flavoprotein